MARKIYRRYESQLQKMRDRAIDELLTDVWSFREVWGSVMMLLAGQMKYFGAPSEYLQYLAESLLSSVFWELEHFDGQDPTRHYISQMPVMQARAFEEGKIWKFRWFWSKYADMAEEDKISSEDIKQYFVERTLWHYMWSSEGQEEFPGFSPLDFFDDTKNPSKSLQISHEVGSKSWINLINRP